jgi:hypothetical protein
MRQLAGSRWQPPMMDNPDSSALMLGAESQATGTSSAISLEAVVTVPSRWPPKAGVCGVTSLWRSSAKLSCVWDPGIQSHAPNGRPALMKSISISTLSSEGTRKRGSEVTAVLTDVPERSVTLQWSADYVARGERDDPRGRKSDGGLGATNRRWPARAEGEKRFRSATRNPYAAIQSVAWW